MSDLNIPDIASLALNNARRLVPMWLPQGKWRGREYVVGALDGRPGESLSINVDTGLWADFSTDDRGSDLVSLYAAIHGLKQGEAARELVETLEGGTRPQHQHKAVEVPPNAHIRPEWEAIIPIPSSAPPPPKKHPTHGEPTHKAIYRDASGYPCSIIYRCEPPGQRKQIVPLTWCRHTGTGREEWRWQAAPKPRMLYGLDALHGRSEAPVLVVEGEPKCDVARNVLASWVVVAWPGGAKAHDRADWSVLKGRDVTIWPDADAPGRSAAKAIAEYLAKSARSVRIVNPPEDVAEGWDAADAIREGWDAGRMQAFLAPPRKSGLPLEYFDEIQPSIETRDFVQGLLFEESSIVVYGESNSGKTFWVTDLALHIAAGLEWHGRRVEQGGVIYCVLEGGHGFRNRIAAWKLQHDSLDSPVHFAAIPASINLLNPEAHTGALIAAIQEAAQHMKVPVKLVVIDTLARAMAGGNENSSEDMGALVMNMDRVRAATKAAVAFVHHSGKDQARGARGHSSLRAAIDTEIEVTADEQAQTRAATVVKQREGKKGDVFGFELHVVELGKNRHGEDVTSCTVSCIENAVTSNKRAKLKGHAARALDILNNLLSENGQSGHRGTPDRVPSVSEDSWRDRFYSDAMPGAPQNTKKTTFSRVAKTLIDKRIVGMSANRIWIVDWESNANEA